MDGVTLIETKDFQLLKDKIERLEKLVLEIAKERSELLKPLMTVKELGAYLDKGPTWIDAHKGDIGFCRVGGEIRFRRKDIEEYLANNYLRGTFRSTKRF